ncbi:MAG: hypothetical protein ABDH21_02570 [bacterium]
MARSVTFLVLLSIILILILLAPAYSYTIAFNHFNQQIKSYISYILFEDRQIITDYKNYTIYEFEYPSYQVQQELYNLKDKEFNSVYIPPYQKPKSPKKQIPLGSLAHIYKPNQIMYLFDYSTVNFYKFLDIELRGLIVALEDNVAYLLTKIGEAKKIEYKSYLDYIKAFGNINQDYELILCYNQNQNIIFDFLNTKTNKIKEIKIDMYYWFDIKEKSYPNNQSFKF